MSDEFLPLSVPTIEGNAWRYVKDCLDTGRVASVWRYVGAFEGAVAKFTRAKHAVAAVTLHLAARLLGLGPDDAVIVPARTFIATANALS